MAVPSSMLDFNRLAQNVPTSRMPTKLQAARPCDRRFRCMLPWEILGFLLRRAKGNGGDRDIGCNGGQSRQLWKRRVFFLSFRPLSVSVPARAKRCAQEVPRPNCWVWPGVSGSKSTNIQTWPLITFVLGMYLYLLHVAGSR
ncbi:hypothetical protein LX32DRAFT_435667 [Colletotrichum zoysiae]|uniref:Uncharacterized protein n=1 Tax=Colletotrichum zoysiae TaxID=1216348 RepID=A0AAD9HED9_9PEZI|nr:hypothetical protein LX32DRAFT_435667 [Colletotrichum zoysiae]